VGAAAHPPPRFGNIKKQKEKNGKKNNLLET
jgi:hypothetical protein